MNYVSITVFTQYVQSLFFNFFFLSFGPFYFWTAASSFFCHIFLKQCSSIFSQQMRDTANFYNLITSYWAFCVQTKVEK